MSRKRDGVLRYWGSLVFVEERSYKSAAKIILKENEDGYAACGVWESNRRGSGAATLPGQSRD